MLSKVTKEVKKLYYKEVISKSKNKIKKKHEISYVKKQVN